MLSAFILVSCVTLLYAFQYKYPKFHVNSHLLHNNNQISKFSSSTLRMGFFDNLFSEDEEAKRRKEEEKEEMMRAQREILERRRNPKKMRVYEEKYEKRRKEYAKERAVYNFQSGDQGDPLVEWERLKKEGKIKVSDEERDESSSRLGSEGLQSVRTDERMPYIDSGYVEGAAIPTSTTVTAIDSNENDDEFEEFDEGPKIKVGKKKSTLSEENRVAAYAEEQVPEEPAPAQTNKESSDILEEGLESMANEAVKAFNNLFGGK